MSSKLLTLLLVRPNPAFPEVAAEAYASIHIDTDVTAVEEEIKKVAKPLEVKMLRHHDDHGLYTTDIDRHGRPLLYLSTHRMAFMLSELQILSEWDQSVMKFLSSLDPTIKVVPWWD